MTEYIPREGASKGVAGTGLGLAIGALGLLFLNGGNGGNGGLLNLGGCNSSWSDKEVSLLRMSDKNAADIQTIAALTPYQIKDATCDFVKAEKYVPAREIVYSTSPCIGSNSAYPYL